MTYLDDGDVRVVLADCVDAMRAMPAASVDAIVTDPPTGVAARAEGVRAILVEREEEYARIIASRLSQLSLLGAGA